MHSHERRNESLTVPRYLEVELCKPIKSTHTKQEFLFKLKTTLENHSRSNETSALQIEDTEDLLPAVKSINNELSIKGNLLLSGRTLSLHENQDTFKILAHPVIDDSIAPHELIHGRIVETESGSVITLHAVRPRYLAVTAGLGVVCIFTILLGILNILNAFGVVSLGLLSLLVLFLVALAYGVYIFLYGFRKPPPALIELVKAQAKGIEPRNSTRP